jgi:hypothetical protein
LPGPRDGRPYRHAPATWQGKTILSDDALGEISSLLERMSVVAHNVKKGPRCKAEKRSHGISRRRTNQK